MVVCKLEMLSFPQTKSGKRWEGQAFQQWKMLVEEAKTTGGYPPVLKHVGNRSKFSFKWIKVVDFFQHTMLGCHRVWPHTNKLHIDNMQSICSRSFSCFAFHVYFGFLPVDLCVILKNHETSWSVLAEGKLCWGISGVPQFAFHETHHPVQRWNSCTH